MDFIATAAIRIATLRAEGVGHIINYLKELGQFRQAEEVLVVKEHFFTLVGFFFFFGALLSFLFPFQAKPGLSSILFPFFHCPTYNSSAKIDSSSLLPMY